MLWRTVALLARPCPEWASTTLPPPPATSTSPTRTSAGIRSAGSSFTSPYSNIHLDNTVTVTFTLVLAFTTTPPRWVLDSATSSWSCPSNISTSPDGVEWMSVHAVPTCGHLLPHHHTCVPAWLGKKNLRFPHLRLLWYRLPKFVLR